MSVLTGPEIALTLNTLKEATPSNTGSSNFNLFLTESGKLNNPSGFEAGDHIEVVVLQDNIGGKVLSFDNAFIFSETDPEISSAPNSYSILSARLCQSGLWLSTLHRGFKSTQPIVVPDTTAPTVSIQSDSSNITAAIANTITAIASDDVGVTKVEIYRGNQLVSTLTSAPYQITESYTSADNGRITYVAKAYDAANNVGTSSTITVTVDIEAAIPSLVLDEATVADIKIALSTAPASSNKRQVVVNSIINAMKPDHRLDIYQNDILVIPAVFTGDCSLIDDGVNVSLGLGELSSADPIVTANLAVGSWTFELSGGAGFSRKITGTVGSTADNTLILSDNPAAGMGFDPSISFLVPDTI